MCDTKGEAEVTDIIAPEQLQQCLRAILDHPKGAREVTSSPAEVFRGIEGMVCINFVNPDFDATGGQQIRCRGPQLTQ